MTAPTVAVGSLGGTITMTSQAEGQGVAPALDADDLVAAAPGLEAGARVQASTLARAPSASLTFADVLGALAWARRSVEGGATGVVLIQGTDTLEETAYLLDLFWNRTAPLVLTGAMRPPHQAGADGPANLLAAVTVAASDAARELGTVVVLNDEVHEARQVRKTHATALHAFTSPDGGPLGRVLEGRLTLHHRPAPRPPALTAPTGADGIRVALLEMSLGDDGELVRRCAEAGYAGIVVSAFGAGHVSQAAADAIEEVAAGIPVVVGSRAGAGSTLGRTYGFAGSEQDLGARGALLSGRLDPRKARLLLWALLGTGASRGAGGSRGAVARELALRGDTLHLRH